MSQLSENSFKPDFSSGLLPAIVQDIESGEVLMLAWMNEQAFELTVATGEAHYWSRSRNRLWHKGEESGNIQKVVAIRLDCDNDAILLRVNQTGGAACHTGHVSCFYRELCNGKIGTCFPRVFDPKDVYAQKR